MNNDLPHSPADLPRLRCEIRATRQLGPILTKIAKTCAADVGQPLELVTLPNPSAAAPSITLVVPAELVLEPHQAWCLACRLACFCADVRVSVLVTGVAEAVAEQPHATAA